MAPIAWDKLLSWKYITGKEAESNRELMKCWGEFENRNKRQDYAATQPPPEDGGLDA